MGHKNSLYFETVISFVQKSVLFVGEIVSFKRYCSPFFKEYFRSDVNLLHFRRKFRLCMRVISLLNENVSRLHAHTNEKVSCLNEKNIVFFFFHWFVYELYSRSDLQFFFYFFFHSSSRIFLRSFSFSLKHFNSIRGTNHYFTL